MNDYISHDNHDFELNENVLAGAVGAFIFALAGGAVYFILHLIGYVASISGLVGAVCAVKGYTLFSKKESKKGIVISAVLSLVVILLAWYLCLCYDVYDAYRIWFESGDVDFKVTFFEAIEIAPMLLEESEIAIAYYKDLGLGLLFCIIGSGSFVVNKFKNAGKKPPVTTTFQPSDQSQNPYQE